MHPRPRAGLRYLRAQCDDINEVVLRPGRQLHEARKRCVGTIPMGLEIHRKLSFGVEGAFQRLQAFNVIDPDGGRLLIIRRLLLDNTFQLRIGWLVRIELGLVRMRVVHLKSRWGTR